MFSTLEDSQSEELCRAIGAAENGQTQYRERGYYIKEAYSGVNSLRYVSLSAKDTAYQRLSHIRFTMVAAYLLCIIIGVVCAVYFSNKNYKPFRDISNLFMKQRLLQSESEDGEEQMLVDVITRLIQDKNQSDKKLYQQKDYVCASVLSKVINHCFSTKVTAEKLYSMCGLELTEEYFVVLAFHIYDQEDSRTDIKEYELQLLIIKNIFEELLSQRYYAYVVEINSVICAIINFGQKERDGYRQTLRTVVESGQSVILNNFNLELAVAASTERQGIDSLSQCYSEAVTGVQYQAFRQSKDLLFYDSLITEKQDGYEYYFSFYREQRLIDCVKAGDKEGAKNIIGEVFEKYNAQSVASINVMRCVMSDVAVAVYKAACQTQGAAAADIPEKIAALKTLDAPALKKEFFSFVDTVCEGVNESTSAKENILVERMKTLIDLEYNNINLNLSYIADKMGLNATYLSRVFLASVGESLLNYMNKYRVEKAKSLMKNPELTVESISALVGFGSSNSFIRVFKKYEYMTPGQYRQMLQKEKT